MSTSLGMSSPNGSDDSLFPAPSDPTTPSNPSSSRRSGPYSPRPHIFGNPNPTPSRGMGQLGSQDGGTSSAGTAPGVPGMVRPSDLMGIEDYKDLRFNTTVKGGVAGIFSGVGTTLLVRQFWPKRPTPNALALVFFGSTMAGTYYASSRFLLKELRKIRHKAEMMSRPQSQGDTSGGYGEPLFGDSAMVDKSTATFGFPEDAPNKRFA